MPTLREVGEIEALRRLIAGGRAREGSAVPAGDARAGDAAEGAVVLGAGDDAAVLRPRDGHDLVATTDALVENVHYLSDWLGAEALGARLATVNLSDLAAMGAAPRWALVSIGARPEREVDDLVALERGIAEALEADGAVIVGGNLTAVAGAEWSSLTLLGETRRGAAWTRHGARAGDWIAVSGFPGRAGAGSRLALAMGEAARAPLWRPLIQAWGAPRSQVPLAMALAAEGAVTAAIDVSDGFAGDLARMCEASGMGATIDEELLPEDRLLEQAARALGVAPEELRFGPSDDYELLVTLAAAGRDACEAAAERLGVPFGVVGVVTETRGRVDLRDSRGEVRPMPRGGYDHFRAASPIR
jgi:thiamine-monophosphate kinase